MLPIHNSPGILLQISSVPLSIIPRIRPFEVILVQVESDVIQDWCPGVHIGQIIHENGSKGRGIIEIIPSPSKKVLWVDVFGKESSQTDVVGILVLVEETDFEMSAKEEDLGRMTEEVSQGFVGDEA